MEAFMLKSDGGTQARRSVKLHNRDADEKTLIEMGTKGISY